MKVFFVLALGRSGTYFLSLLLSKDARGVVHHEPHGYDDKLPALRHAGKFDPVVDQMLERRFADLLPRDGTVEFYGEVNSFLRYEVDWLRRRFDPVMIHLVRDGRDFVRSAFIRELYTAWQPDSPILPRDDDPCAHRWAGLSRFQQICWLWQHTNEHLASRIPDFVRFEDLLSDYTVLEERVLRPTGLRVSRELWSREVNRPKNTSRRFRLRKLARGWISRNRRTSQLTPIPHWTRWEPSMTAQFWEICGDTMRRFGYDR